jgi:hypothetical protein
MDRSRTPAKLSESIHRQLNKYALAAGAVGVGALALAQPAEAEIVYTPAHVKMSSLGFYPIDFNHDGKVDVGIWRTAGQTTTLAASNLLAYPNPDYGNAVVLNPESQFDALAVRPGGKIGAFRKFGEQQPNIAGIGVNKVKSTYQWNGMWANGGKGLKNAYLGVKFKIDSEFHYGWARITVVTGPKSSFYGLLTGYAYETIAGKAIVAGQTKGTEDIPEAPDAALTSPTSEPATLSALALGAPGLSIWRREDSASEHN